MGAAKSTGLENIQGSVERVTFHNAENGYCVIRVQAKGQRDPVTVLGHVPSISAGEYIEATGDWIQHAEYGLQFRATWLKTVHPSTLEGIEKYLGSGMVKGIGPHFAKKLVEAFGFDVFDVIESEPAKLGNVPGIGPARMTQITTAWKQQRAVRDIMVFLQSHGVSSLKAVRIFKTYGHEAVSKVMENPYRLAADIHGIGFKSADLIAGNLGISKTSVIRARAGLHHVLFECMSHGHSAYPRDKLIEESTTLLEIDAAILSDALQQQILSGALKLESIDGTECIFTVGMYRAECELAGLVSRLATHSLPWGEIQASKAVEWVENKLALQLAELQRNAVLQALSSKVFIITGGPGTGKTTITRALVTILAAKKIRLALCSPTGRAAKRLSECTGLEAKTIHRCLGVDRAKGGFLHTVDNLLQTDCVIVDEVSMVDTSLAYSLVKAIPLHAALVLIGDVDQLPSVGPGKVLGALLESGRIPAVRLTQVFRQAAESRIIQVAHEVNQGRVPDLHTPPGNSDFYFISSETPEETIPKLVEIVKSRIPKRFGFDPVRDIQVLCPMNRGGLGARSLNIELQKAINPNPTIKIEKFGMTFAPGDKVIVTQNDYDKDVFNGDIGLIESLDLVESVATVDFDGRQVQFSFSEMDILSLAYAITVHKSQGSEYPAVVIPLAMQHYLMLKRNLIYTGLTRGKKLVVVIGQKKALAIAVKNSKQDERWSNLTARLQAAFRECLTEPRELRGPDGLGGAHANRANSRLMRRSSRRCFILPITPIDDTAHQPRRIYAYFGRHRHRIDAGGHGADESNDYPTRE